MAHVVCAWFDDELESRVRSLWADLHAAGATEWRMPSTSRPHVSLAAYDELALDEAVGSLTAVVRETWSFAVAFPSLCVFPAERPIVALGAVPSLDLRALHSCVHDVTRHRGSGANPHYVEDGWVPHCTLTMSGRRDGLERLLDVVGPELPLRGRIAHIGVIETPRSTELWSTALS